MNYKDIKENKVFYTIINFTLVKVEAKAQYFLNENISFWKSYKICSSYYDYWENIHPHTPIFERELDGLIELSNILSDELAHTERRITYIIEDNKF